MRKPPWLTVHAGLRGLGLALLLAALILALAACELRLVAAPIAPARTEAELGGGRPTDRLPRFYELCSSSPARMQCSARREY